MISLQKIITKLKSLIDKNTADITALNNGLAKRFTLIYTHDVIQDGAGSFSADLSSYKMVLIVCRKQDTGSDFVTAVVPVAMYTDNPADYRLECDGKYRIFKVFRNGISWGTANGDYPTAYIVPTRIYGL